MISPRLSRRLICSAVLLHALLLTSVVARADADNPPRDFAARLDAARTEKKIDGKLAALVALSGTLSLTEIPEALQVAEKIGPLRERVVLTEALLRRWGELAPAEAFEHAARMPEGMTRVQCLRSIVPVCAKQDVRATAEAVLKMRPGRARAEAVQMVVEEWARQDVKTVLKWVEELPEGFPKDAALQNIYFIWVHLDPAGIASTVRNLPPGDIRNALTINVAGDWAATDAASAIKWAEGLPDEADKRTALATVAESWADVEPLAAAEFALGLSPRDLRRRAVLAALQRWATQDPQQALAWITKVQDDPELQQQGVAEILNIYVPVSPEAAGRQVDQLTPGPLRESAIGAYAEAVCTWDPEAGARLALKTAEPVARETRVEPCFLQWLAWHPSAARTWLAEAPFSDEVKNRWLAAPPQTGP